MTLLILVRIMAWLRVRYWYQKAVLHIIPQYLNACLIGSILSGGQGFVLLVRLFLFDAFLTGSPHISFTWAIQQVSGVNPKFDLTRALICGYVAISIPPFSLIARFKSKCEK